MASVVFTQPILSFENRIFRYPSRSSSTLTFVPAWRLNNFVAVSVIPDRTGTSS